MQNKIVTLILYKTIEHDFRCCERIVSFERVKEILTCDFSEWRKFSSFSFALIVC